MAWHSKRKEPKLRDISIGVHEGTPEWPGDTPYSCKWTWAMSQGASVNLSALTSSPHVGTHADAPLHVKDGWPGAHELPLEAFHGECVVLDFAEAAGEIGLQAVEAAARDLGVGRDEIRRLLLRTGHTVAGGAFPGEWPTLSEHCAQALLGRGLRLLGVDCPSVDARESKTLPVHHMIFGGNACILENLDLRRVRPGRYDLIAFPVKLMGLDAAPVRAVLRELPIV